MRDETMMVDMDEVIVKNGLINLINEFYRTSYTENDFDNYYIQDTLPDKKAFFEYFFTKNLYDYSEFCTGAKEVLRELNEYYKLYIGTSYIFKEYPERAGIILKYKYDFLTRELPFLDPYKFVFLGDKSVLNCSIKVDDRIDNLSPSKTKILYSAYHNHGYSDEYLDENGIVRVNDWYDVRKLLLK